MIVISLDLETGGEECGVTQISAIAFRLDGTSVGDDFDAYVKPPASAKWNQISVNLTGLHANDQRIMQADPIETVWPKFTTWVEELPESNDDQLLLVAWSGTGSDMKWIFKLTSQSGRWKLKMPKGCDFFCDPCHAINHYPSCLLHPSKTGKNLTLETIYEHITGSRLEGAHNSLVDARGQKTVLLDSRFLDKFFDTKYSIVPVDKVLKAKEKNEIKQQEELTKEVPNVLTFQRPRSLPSILTAWERLI